MRDIDKPVDQPKVDTSPDDWDGLAISESKFGAYGKILAGVLEESGSAALREDLTALLQEVPSLYLLLNQDARGDRRITILDHTVDVLEQCKAYQAADFLPAGGLSPIAFSRFLLGHDSGKSLPIEKAEASKYTVRTIESHNDFFQFSEREMAIVKALLHSDPIGRVMHCGVCPFDRETEAKFAALRNELNGDIPLEEREKIDPRYVLKARHAAGTLTLADLEQYSAAARVTDDSETLKAVVAQSAEEITAAAAATDMSPEAFLQLISVFYQLDASSYSMDVGKKREVGLEFLFQINPEFSIRQPEAQKMFLPDAEGSLPLQFSAAAATCYGSLRDLVQLNSK